MANCTNKTNVSNVKVQEARSRHAIFSNPTNHDYKVTRFDGCVLTQTTACDFIVEKCGVARIVVELKGADIDHAERQLSASINYLKQNGINELKIGGLIVCTRVPAISGKVQILKQRFAKEHKALLTIKQDARGLKIEDLVFS